MRVGASTQESGGDTNLQSITAPDLKHFKVGLRKRKYVDFFVLKCLSGHSSPSTQWIPDKSELHCSELGGLNMVNEAESMSGKQIMIVF